jgi:hypothetical protein
MQLIVIYCDTQNALFRKEILFSYFKSIIH